MVNKLDPKWSDLENKMQPSSNLTPSSVIYKATQETFMQRSDLVWKSHKTKSIQVLQITKYNSWIFKWLHINEQIEIQMPIVWIGI